MLQRLAALRSRAFTAACAAPWQAGAGRPTERTFAALPLEVARDEAAFFGDLPQPRFRGLTLDAAGTLLSPSEPAAEVYLRAYNAPWGTTGRRYIDDGRDFWRHIVAKSTGCSDEKLHEEIYQYFAQPEAWQAAPQAVAALSRLRDAGVRLAVVSNFDTRLRPLLAAMQLDRLFDAIFISAEVGAEKPNPVIFELACEALDVRPEEVVHVGDDRRNDVFGARDAGCFAWLYGLDVLSMHEMADRILWGSEDDDRLRAIARW